MSHNVRILITTPEEEPVNPPATTYTFHAADRKLGMTVAELDDALQIARTNQRKQLDGPMLAPTLPVVKVRATASGRIRSLTVEVPR